MQRDTANPGDGGGGLGGFAQAWAAWLEPLAQELRRTEPGTDGREHAATHVIQQARATIRSINSPGDTPLAGMAGGGQWLRHAAPLLCCWPQLHAPLQALESAVARLERATHAATGELEQLVDLAAGHWWQEAMAAPASAIDAWWLAERWSLAMETAWDERLQADAHGQALHELQQSREALRQAGGSLLDAAAKALGLPGPSAVSDLEAAVDRLDRGHDREIDALRIEVAELREEVHHLRQERNRRD